MGNLIGAGKEFLTVAMEIHTIWTYLGIMALIACSLWTFSSTHLIYNCSYLGTKSGWNPLIKSVCGDHVWFVNIENINILRIFIKIIANINQQNWRPWMTPSIYSVVITTIVMSKCGYFPDNGYKCY